MSNLNTTASIKHLAETIKKAKSTRCSIYLYYGNFADYTHIDNRSTIEAMSIDGDFLNVPMMTNRGYELYSRRYPLKGLYIAIKQRSQRHLVDSKNVLSRAITDVMNPDDDIFYNSNNLEHALQYSTNEMTSNYTFNDACIATFNPANKPLLFLEDGSKYTRAFQQIKIGKAVRSICNDVLNMGLSDSNVEAITNRIKSQFAPIEILTSGNVAEVYALNHGTRSECGTLADSCMRGKSEFYQDLSSSENCKVLYSLNCDGELIARALLWSTACGKMVMDRIYGTDANVLKFIEFAKGQGYYYKYEQNYSNTSEFVNPTTGEKENLYMDIEINELDTYNSPFMDTFHYYNENDVMYYLSNENNSDTTHTLRETDGTASTW